MKRNISDLLTRFTLKSGASEGSIEQLQVQLGVKFPEEYLAFLRESDGGEGMVGESYLALWASERIVVCNQGYQVEERAPGLVLFGADGGGEAYAFDTRVPSMPVVMVPFVGMSLREAIPIGETFFAFLQCLYDGRQWTQ